MGETGCLKDGNFQNLQIESSLEWKNFGGDYSVRFLMGMTDSTLGVNFGAPTGSTATAAGPIAPVVPTTQTVPLQKYVAASDYIKFLQASDGTITSAQAKLLLGPHAAIVAPVSATLASSMTSHIGADMSTVTLTGAGGGITTGAADDSLAAQGRQALVLFNNVTIAHSGVLKLEVNGACEFLQGGSKIFVSDNDGSSGIGGLELETTGAEPATDDDQIVITASGTGGGTTTILHGSYLWFNCVAAADNKLHVHGVLLTSGGTVAVTFAA